MKPSRSRIGRPTSVSINVLCLVAQLCPTLCDPMDCSSPGSSVHGDSPGKNIGVGCHALLRGIFLTKGWKPGLLHCRWILYQLSHQGSPALNKALRKAHPPSWLSALTHPVAPPALTAVHFLAAVLPARMCPAAHLWGPAAIEVAQLFLIFLEMQHPGGLLTFFW